MWKFESTKQCVIDNSCYCRNNPVIQKRVQSFQNFWKESRTSQNTKQEGKILGHKQMQKLEQKLTMFCGENKKLPSNFRLFRPLFVAQGRSFEPASPHVPLSGLRQQRVGIIPWHIETDLFLNGQQIENLSPLFHMQPYIHTHTHAHRHTSTLTAERVEKGERGHLYLG